MPKDKNNLIFMTPEQLEEDVKDMTNTLKIPGKIVGASRDHDGHLHIITETQVYWLDKATPHLFFDIADYQDKPTEKELEGIKAQKKLLKDAKKLLEVFVERQIYGKDEKKAEIADIIAAIEALNRMDGYHG